MFIYEHKDVQFFIKVAVIVGNVKRYINLFRIKYYE
jgi:hypothetical protein